jgi:hypothetical protein
MIRHLPLNTPAEDICDRLVSLGFDVVSVKQMTTTRRSSPKEPKVTNLPLFLITLPRSAKSQDIFHLPSLCHIAIKVEAYRTQSALTQCHNYQQFGHIWANCNQLPRCLWCRGGHLHKECPEKENAASTACCNCKLLEEEKPHPANYRGCRHVREKLQKRKSQKTPRTTTGRLFSYNTITPGVSFAAALRGGSAQKEQPQATKLPVVTPPTEAGSKLSPGRQQKSGQSVRAPSVNKQPNDDMLTAVTIVQQIMTEFRGTVSDEDKILAITKIVFNLMNQNGH